LIKIIPYGRQSIDDDDIKAVVEVLKSDLITQGPKIAEFERALAEYCGTAYAVIFSSGTAALHAAYFSVVTGPGDEIITSPLTFVATVNAGLYLGAKPVFVDVEKNTGNIATSKIEEKITKNTKLIVPVHYAGHPAGLKEIYEIAHRYNIFVIEDACHALGAKYEGERIGNCRYSDLTVFSFHPVKNITTGEGGAVVTNSEDFYSKLRMFRNHGITKETFLNKSEGDWYYEMHCLGYNYRMTDIQAALGISQLKKVDSFVERRRAIAGIYDNAFRGNPNFDIPIEEALVHSSYHLYPIRLKDDLTERKRLIFSKLRECGLGVQVHYIPVYFHPHYQNLGYRKGTCPVAENFYRKELSIPLYPAMTKLDIDYVIEVILRHTGE
jgi:UDP-4-amino-4,6-dideoxy-N-acetyl-beta-L-altrosamine transaminase